MDVRASECVNVFTFDNESIRLATLHDQLGHEQTVDVPCDAPADTTGDRLVALLAGGGPDLRTERPIRRTDDRRYFPGLRLARLCLFSAHTQGF